MSCEKLFNTTTNTLKDGYSFDESGAIVNNELNMVVCDPKVLSKEESAEFKATHPTKDISGQFTENQVSSTKQIQGINHNPLQVGPSPVVMIGLSLVAGIVVLVVTRKIVKMIKSRKEKNAKRV